MSLVKTAYFELISSKQLLAANGNNSHISGMLPGSQGRWSWRCGGGIAEISEQAWACGKSCDANVPNKIFV